MSTVYWARVHRRPATGMSIFGWETTSLSCLLTVWSFLEEARVLHAILECNPILPLLALPLRFLRCSIKNSLRAVTAASEWIGALAAFGLATIKDEDSVSMFVSLWSASHEGGVWPSSMCSSCVAKNLLHKALHGQDNDQRINETSNKQFIRNTIRL